MFSTDRFTLFLFKKDNYIEFLVIICYNRCQKGIGDDMSSNTLKYNTESKIIVFTGAIKSGSPYISKLPRNHESLFYVTKGNLIYESAAVRAVIREGNVGYIPRGFSDKSSAYECETVEYIAINLNIEDVNKTEYDLPFSPVIPQSSKSSYEKLFGKLLSVFNSKRDGYLYLSHGIIMQIIGQLMLDESILRRNNENPLELIINEMKENFSNPNLRICDLARSAGMSEKNFRRVFEKIYQKKPYAFLQEYRIEQAEFLLKYTSQNISDIALRCGFSDVYSFSHAFKRINKISPLKFRGV